MEELKEMKEMKETNKNVILYCRASSGDQTQSTSLEKQETELKEYCVENKYNIVKCYKEDCSAKTASELPEMQKLMSYCTKHYKNIDEILFFSWDRYARNSEVLINVVELNNLGIVVSAIKNPLESIGPTHLTMLEVYLGV